MRTDGKAAVASLMLACVGLAGCGAEPGPTGVTHLPGQTAAQPSGSVTSEPAPPQAVMDAAKNALQSGRVVGPVEWVLGTLQDAEGLTSRGPSVPVADDVPVYLVQVRGEFRLDSAPRPSGARSPEGTVMLLYFPVTPDPQAGNSGMSLTEVAVDLSAVGPVHTFELP